MAVLLHALAALVFGDLRFPAFLQGAHKCFIKHAGFPERNASIGCICAQQTSFFRKPARAARLAKS